MASLYCDLEVTNLAICWNGSVLVSTACSKNLTGYTQSAGNRLNYFSFLYIKYFIDSSIKKSYIHMSSSETTRKESFNFDAFLEAFKNLNPDICPSPLFVQDKIRNGHCKNLSTT